MNIHFTITIIDLIEKGKNYRISGENIIISDFFPIPHKGDFIDSALIEDLFLEDQLDKYNEEWESCNLICREFEVIKMQIRYHDLTDDQMDTGKNIGIHLELKTILSAIK